VLYKSIGGKVIPPDPRQRLGNAYRAVAGQIAADQYAQWLLRGSWQTPDHILEAVGFLAVYVLDGGRCEFHIRHYQLGDAEVVSQVLGCTLAPGEASDNVATLLAGSVAFGAEILLTIDEVTLVTAQQLMAESGAPAVLLVFGQQSGSQREEDILYLYPKVEVPPDRLLESIKAQLATQFSR
jgi:hypothetical protein